MPTFTYTPTRFTIPDLAFEIARGNVSGYDYITKFGENPDVDTGSVEDIWDGGDTYSEPTSLQGHKIVSTSVSDAAAGAGARTIDIYGLDGDYVSASETITLNGTTPVDTSGSFIRLNRMIVRTAGSDGTAAGTISACAPDDDTVTAQIAGSANQTLMAISTIPASTTGYLVGYYAGISRNVVNGAVDVHLKVRPSGEVYQVKHTMGLVAAGTSHNYHVYPIPIKLTEKSDVKISAETTANNTDVSAGFDIILVNNSQS